MQVEMKILQKKNTEMHFNCSNCCWKLEIKFNKTHEQLCHVCNDIDFEPVEEKVAEVTYEIQTTTTQF